MNLSSPMASSLQDEESYPLRPNTYAWSQNDDQLTISFLIPDNLRSKDIDVTIEANYLRAGVRGQEPVVKPRALSHASPTSTIHFQGRLYSPIRHTESLWQLEKTPSALSSLANSPALSSAASSFAIVTPPLSPNTSLILPPPAMDLPDTSDSGSSTQSLPARAQHKFHVVTVHLEKGDDVIWPKLITSGISDKMDVDATSAYHLGVMYETQRDTENSFIFYLHAAEHGHTKSMLKVAAMYEIGKQASLEEPSMLPVYPERDPHAAFSWHKRAADLSNDPESGTTGPDAEACYVVGMNYVTGNPDAGIARDYSQALRYFSRAMVLTAPFLDIGAPDALAPRNRPPETPAERFFCTSAFQSGLIYYQSGSSEDSADQPGDAPSITSDDMPSIASDPALGIEYWKRSALVGHAQSAFNVGITYLNGVGVEAPDRWEAARWFTRARRLDVEGSLAASMPDHAMVEWDARRPSEEGEDEGPGSLWASLLESAAGSATLTASTGSAGSGLAGSAGSATITAATTSEGIKAKRRKSHRKKDRRSKGSRSSSNIHNETDPEGLVWKMTAAAVSTGAVIGVAWLLWRRLGGRLGEGGW
ncbi:hypothetical protein BC937DRAFT_94949 [Endogone sp. FLAS-F59071]|nr:hypothetical protein BC937DRAFT_94949 [Endogone sp. FLAS-F59071]|eukprot:RUS20555.1 hypothetical protein BC937DRAFT_94949 [Endogone sp. FLAS-F59071]